MKLKFLLIFIALLNIAEITKSQTVNGISVSKLCKLADISIDKVDSTLVAFKVMYNSTDFLLCVIPVKTEIEVGFYMADIHILKVHSKTNEIIIHSILKDAIVSDAVNLYKVFIDSVPYMIRKDYDAFAIRMDFANNSSIANFDTEEFKLIEESNGSFKMILSLDCFKSLYNGGGDCENKESYEQRSIFVMSSNKQDDGYFDLIEHMSFSHQHVDKNCDSIDVESKNIENVFHYIEDSYQCKSNRIEGF